jgi:hypothetical protein
MEIKPIVFQVTNVPATSHKSAGANWLPWMVVAILVAALLVLGVRNFRDGGDGPQPAPPTPIVIEDSVAKLTEADTREYLLGIAGVFEDLAAKVETRQIQNITQLQSNSRAATVAVREAAYKEVNALDNERVNGEYAGKEAAVAAYLRSKADGYKRAAK